MREIKFRAWDNYLKQWMTGEDIYEELLDQALYNPEKKEFFILMQYTGIKDKNGVEIYEGDILKRGHENNPTFYAHIEFQKGGFVGATYPNRNHVIPISALSTCDCDGKGYDTVVGNIYEQPDPSTMTD